MAEITIFPLLAIFKFSCQYIFELKRKGFFVKNKFLQILRFVVGGGIGVLVFYIILYVFTEFLGVWYILSTIVAFVFNIGTNFFIQKFWTFANRGVKNIPKQFSLYFVMGLCFLGINAILLYSLVEYAHLYYLIAQLILTILLTTSSFFITRRIFTTK